MSDKSYFVFPDAGDGFYCSTTPEPLTIPQVKKNLEGYVELMRLQGGWVNSKGQKIAPSQVRFVIQHKDFIAENL